MAEEKKQKIEEKKVEIPENLKDIVKEIEELKLKDLAKLVKILEDKFDITAQAPVMAAPVQGAPTSGAAPAEEKTEFNVELKNAGPSKIQVIKTVKEITGKGLKESKEVADAAEKSPQILKEKVKKEEAEALKKKLEEAGATVEIK